jgi:hypothetical protein
MPAQLANEICRRGRAGARRTGMFVKQSMGRERSMSPPLAGMPTPFYGSGGEATPPLVKRISSNSILEIAASVLRISKN